MLGGEVKCLAQSYIAYKWLGQDMNTGLLRLLTTIMAGYFFEIIIFLCSEFSLPRPSPSPLVLFGVRSLCILESKFQENRNYFF